jgi:hypothetical protein
MGLACRYTIELFKAGGEGSGHYGRFLTFFTCRVPLRWIALLTIRSGLGVRLGANVAKARPHYLQEPLT